jgi:tetratricopeptide (TPR) repeat protein
MKKPAFIPLLALLCVCLLQFSPAHAQNAAPLPAEVEARAAQDPFVRAARQLRQSTGRDNALIYYQEASFLAPEHTPDEATQDLLRKVIREGWSEEAKTLLPYLTRWNAAIAYLQRGAAIDFAEGIGAHSGIETPVPNFLFLVSGARILVAQGRYYESAGQYDQAVSRHLAAHRMGRDLGSKNNTLISVLISVSIQNAAHEGLSALVRSGKLDDAQFLRIRDAIIGLDRVYAGVADAFRMEQELAKQSAAMIRESLQSTNPDALRQLQLSFTRDMGAPRAPSREEIGQMLESYDDEIAKYFAALLPNASRESHEFDIQRVNAHFTAMIEGFQSPLSKMSLPNFVEARVREDVMIAKRRLILTQIALERHKLQHGSYPDSLDLLVSAFVDALPTDPFSGQPFRYRVTEGGADYSMYSLGPDKQDNPQAGAYDPTNGTISGGVIY